MAVSATLVAIVLVPLGGCSLSNTVRGAGNLLGGAGDLVAGLGQDMALMADGTDQEVARQANNRAVFGSQTTTTNANWTGRNR